MEEAGTTGFKEELWLTDVTTYVQNLILGSCQLKACISIKTTSILGVPWAVQQLRLWASTAGTQVQPVGELRSHQKIEINHNSKTLASWSCFVFAVTIFLTSFCWVTSVIESKLAFLPTDVRRCFRSWIHSWCSLPTCRSTLPPSIHVSLFPSTHPLHSQVVTPQLLLRHWRLLEHNSEPTRPFPACFPSHLVNQWLEADLFPKPFAEKNTVLLWLNLEWRRWG